MSEIDIEKVSERYAARQALYKKFGCDPQGENWFVIEKSLPLEGRILEVGFGQGYFLKSLLERGYQVTGVEPSTDDLAIARFNLEQAGLAHCADLQLAGGEELPFADNFFDVIFSIKVFHHLESPLIVLDEMIRVLAPEGKIVISDFSEAGFALVEKIHQMEGGAHPCLGLPLAKIKACLADKGFGVQHERTRFQETLIAYGA